VNRILAALIILATIGISCSARADTVRCFRGYNGDIVCQSSPY
jgi:hypothetical protein